MNADQSLLTILMWLLMNLRITFTSSSSIYMNNYFSDFSSLPKRNAQTLPNALLSSALPFMNKFSKRSTKYKPKNDSGENKYSSTYPPNSNVELSSKECDNNEDSTMNDFYTEMSQHQPTTQGDNMNFSTKNLNNATISEEQNRLNSHSYNKTSKVKYAEYQGKSVGIILNTFGSESYGSNKAMSLPIFLTEPENAYILKNKPAVLKCKAMHALQLNFKCSGSSQPPPSNNEKHADPHTGAHFEEVTAIISQDLLDEYFGQSPYKCECQAWSSRGMIRSHAAIVSVAYIRKQFVTSPTSLRVERGTRVDLYCEPPIGNPTPKMTWIKNDAVFTNELQGNSISPKGVLSFEQITLQDMANYTCVAENLSGKRSSEAAVLIVYVNGGWSSWSLWKECVCSGKGRGGKKRIRFCNNPFPINGGSYCSGPQMQKTLDCISCTANRWSAWSDWSVCSINCLQLRRRECLSQTIDETKLDADDNGSARSGSCFGSDVQTVQCTGGHCAMGEDDFDRTFYFVLILTSAVFITFGALFTYCARNGEENNSNYKISRTVLDSQYTGTVDVKFKHDHSANPKNESDIFSQRCESDNNIVDNAISEHHYDVPIISSIYVNPIGEINTDYMTGFPDNSAYTSNFIYEISAKQPKLATASDVKRQSLTSEIINSNGGRLQLYNGDIMLYIPDLAVDKNQKMELTLTVLCDDTDCISIPSQEPLMVCSAVVQCKPVDHSFLKPLVLKIPHCLTNRDQWDVRICNSNSDHANLNLPWRIVSTVGHETINTPVFAQLDSLHAYLMIEKLGRYVILAEPKPGIMVMGLSIRMKLFAFVQRTPTTSILRIYVVKDFPYSGDICSRVEDLLGGTFLEESPVFKFYLNNKNLRIHIRPSNLDDLEFPAEEQEQIIPYTHIVNNNNFLLHCEFSVHRMEEHDISTYLFIGFTQESRSEIREYFKICIKNRYNKSASIIPYKATTFYVHDRGSCVSDIGSLENIQIPLVIRRKICAALDQPRADEHDWRLLARKLNTDSYIAYFATKPSPTEHILSLLECRANNSANAITKLVTTLKEMNRWDVAHILEKIIEQQWM